MAYTNSYNRLNIPYGSVQPLNLGRSGYRSEMVSLPSVQSPDKTTRFDDQLQLAKMMQAQYQSKFRQGEKNWSDLCLLKPDWQWLRKIGQGKPDWCYDDFYTNQGFENYLVIRGISDSQIKSLESNPYTNPLNLENVARKLEEARESVKKKVGQPLVWYVVGGLVGLVVLNKVVGEVL